MSTDLDVHSSSLAFRFQSCCCLTSALQLCSLAYTVTSPDSLHATFFGNAIAVIGVDSCMTG